MLHQRLLLICAIIASLVTATIAHACEVPAALNFDCTAALHLGSNIEAAPTADEIEMGKFNHHSCHGVSNFISGSSAANAELPQLSKTYHASTISLLLIHRTDPKLRPPIA